MAIQRSKNEEIQQVSAAVEDDGVDLVSGLRPKTFQEYIGQHELKKNLEVLIEASKLRSEAIDHLLFYGPPGLGKTTLAGVIANESGSGIKVTSGPALEKQGDVASIISNLKQGDILFIDEIHRLKPAVEEMLYSAMEDFGIDIIIGKGPSARSMRLKLPRFTLIGATTKMSMLSSPLRDRFGALFKLDFYQGEDIKKIVFRSASLLGVEISEDAAQRLADSSRATPRIANRLLRRVRDYAQVKETVLIDLRLVNETLGMLGIDDLGLDKHDRGMLETMHEKFGSRPVGLSTIAAATSEDPGTLEDVYEPYLIQLGFLERTARGRVITEKAIKHIIKTKQK